MPRTVKCHISVRVKGGNVRIGELSKRSLVPVRMLRYYEERGLLSPQRGTNGYREYSESDVTSRARQQPRPVRTSDEADHPAAA
ncbi:MerR family DNA-binding transcriptional regulator [Micromonospora sp. CA-259024]|uniref:MerR family DNA-binding transcriptional regulator n=1 Tax=Micromonospora sp. CA-259024 TaxID=3239965 RepID=UPI003D8B3C31